MKRITVILLIGLMVGPMALAGGSRQKGKRGGENGGSQAVVDLPLQEIDETERADLLFLREEEKLARDVYLALKEEWGLKVFRNIARSEQIHMNAVLTLLTKYDIEDPVGEAEPGEFTNPDLQDLYDDLLAQGLLSRDDAVIVGATIEDMDIHDLQQMLGRTDNTDLKIVYQNLMKGSRNHLRAFHRQLVKYDLSYTPQYITQAEYDEIVSTPKERKRLDENGDPVDPKERRRQRHRNRHRHR